MADVDNGQHWRDQHWPWLGFALDEALRLGLTRPDDVIQYATPEVMAAQLPHDLMATVLSKALAAGQLNATAILETATAAQLAEHLEPEILWRCIDDIAALSELATEGGAARSEARRWLARVLQRALESKLLEPSDVVRFLPPAQFVKNAPLAVIAELIRSGLTRGQFNPEVVLTHLTPEVIAENLATHLAWACITDAAVRRFELPTDSAPAQAAKPATPAKAAPAAAATPAKASSEKSGPVKTATSLLNNNGGGNGNGASKSATSTTSTTATATAKAAPATAAKAAVVAATAAPTTPWEEEEAIDPVEEAPLPPAPPTPAAIRADRR